MDEAFVETFKRDGVAELGLVLTPAEVDLLRDSLDRHLLNEASEAYRHSRDLADSLDGTKNRDSVRYLVDLYKFDARVYQIICKEKLLNVAEALLGPDIQLFRDQTFYKPAAVGGEVFMHQDNRYWHLSPPEAVIIWLALDNVTVANGCMHYLKGSHLWTDVSYRRPFNGASVLLEAEVDKGASVAFELPVGHATVHHCCTIHWSPPNSSPFPRRCHTIAYMKAGLTAKNKPCSDKPLLRGKLPRTA